MAPQMAFIGLGQMGQAMSTRIVQRSDLTSPLLLFNRSTQIALDHSKAIGFSEAAASVAEAVKPAQIVWSCLADDYAVNEVYDEICKADISGKLFVDCTTMPPGNTDTIHEKLEAKGARFVAMPVFGEPGTATAGNLIVVPAGHAADINQIRPYLKGCMAGTIVDFSGERPSRAALLKTVGNVLVMTTIELVAELMVFAEKTGLGPENVRKLFAALYPGGPQQHLMYSGHMATGEWATRVPIITVDGAINLTDKTIELAQQYGAELKSYQVAREHLKDAKRIGSGSIDILAIYGAVRAESGLKFKSD